MTTIGVLGQHWRATVTPSGSVLQWDGLPALSWYVAADDRWHRPEVEPSIRQHRVAGTPVVETRLRIPSGDAVHRVFAVADGAGMTIIEVENDSSLPIAVAFDGVPLLSRRPPTDARVAGLELSTAAMMFPIGHHATLTVAIPHDGRVRPLPSMLPSSAQVVAGWTAIAERSSRLAVPDVGLIESISSARCELLLNGLGSPTDDPVAFLLEADEILRMTGDAADWVPEIADAVHAVLRLPDAWDVRAALDAADSVLTVADERRATQDLARHRRGVAAAEPVVPADAQHGVRLVAAAQRRIACRSSLFPAGIPVEWLGQNFEVHGVPVGPSSVVSLAVRWHGERPAVLWEVTGAPVTLTSPVAAPQWSDAAPKGETLWPAPFVAPPMDPVATSSSATVLGESISFS